MHYPDIRFNYRIYRATPDPEHYRVTSAWAIGEEHKVIALEPDVFDEGSYDKWSFTYINNDDDDTRRLCTITTSDNEKTLVASASVVGDPDVRAEDDESYQPRIWILRRTPAGTYTISMLPWNSDGPEYSWYREDDNRIALRVNEEGVAAQTWEITQA